MMLLCEVVLGNVKELNQYEQVEKLEAGLHSVKGCGRQFPNPDDYIVLPSGEKVPYG